MWEEGAFRESLQLYKDSASSNKLWKNNNKYVSNFRKHNVKHVAENNDCLSSSNLDINNEDDNMLMNVYDIGNGINIVKPNIYKFEINSNFIPLEIDSGACVSLISEKYCKDMNLDIDMLLVKVYPHMVVIRFW